MLNGGRILVAGVGVVVLIVAAVFVVRSIWWDTTSDSKPFAPNSLSAQPSSTPPEGEDASTDPTDESDPGGGGGGDTGGGETDESTGPSTSTDPSGAEKPGGTTDSEKAPYEPTTKKVNRILGSVSVDVEVPQVTGPDSAVVDAFNGGMESALLGQASRAGTLKNRPGSDVVVGKQVLSGVLATSLTDGSGKSTPLVGTVVVDVESGQEITLASLFDDESTGLSRLVALSEELGPEANSAFDSSLLEADEAVFEDWTAAPAGMTVYFPRGAAAPSAAGVIELTIPWSRLDDVLNPSVAEVVSG
jgi:uncharacterized protein DUF3298